MDSSLRGQPSPWSEAPYSFKKPSGAMPNLWLSRKPDIGKTKARKKEKRAKIGGEGTSLHRAAELGKLDVVQLFIKRGAHTGIKDTKGRTALELVESDQSAYPIV